MIRSRWIPGIGLLLVLLMAVRVSITPGVRHQHQHQHQHQHGNHPHSHHHGHDHHPHPHESAESNSKTASNDSHVHIFVFGWEFTFSSPFADGEIEAPPEAVAEATGSESQMPSLNLDPAVTSASGWGTLLQWVFDIRSPSPPAKLELPKGVLSCALCASATSLTSRDRDKPTLPPPECGRTSLTIG